MRYKAIILRFTAAALVLGAAVPLNVAACAPTRQPPSDADVPEKVVNGAASSPAPQPPSDADVPANVVNGAASSPAPQPPSDADVPANVVAPDFCPPPGTQEEGGPQSRLLKGGCLERISYFYDPSGKMPPDDLPTSVIGVKAKGGGAFEATLRRINDKKTVSYKDKGKDRKVSRYQATVTTTEGVEFNLCDNGGKAIAVPGFWDYEYGTYQVQVKERSVFSLSCATGVVAKCIDWGYVPWSGDTREQALYSSCLHAARGEFNSATAQKEERYKAYTCNGTTVYVFDKDTINHKNLGPEFKFEAAWNEKGIVCMDRPRFTGCTFSTRPCTASERDGWPEGVLIKTYSKDNVASGRKCPTSLAACSNPPGR